jgi:hypothetical protein
MSTREIRVHSDRDGQPRCGQPRAREVTADRQQVTCATCVNLLNGTHGTQVNRPSSNQWSDLDLKPCGTTAAYRRHLRRQGKPVRCESCLQGERRRVADRNARTRRGAGTYRRAA